MNKLIWVIQAFESQTPEGQIMDKVTLEVFSKSEKEAIKKAKGLVKKKFYRLSAVIEKNDT